MDKSDRPNPSDADGNILPASLFRLANQVFSPVDNASVTLFRIGVGAMFSWWAWDYLATGRVQSIYVEPSFHFSYKFFDWVQPLQPNGMIAVFIAIMALGLLVCAGVFYRWSSLILALTFAYIFLLEKTNYQNHYYLMILIACWMPWLPLAKNVSYDASRFQAIKGSIMNVWVLWILRFHIALPYIFGGLAKLHGDWLAGEPMRQILASQTQMPLVGQYLSNEPMVMFFVWGGLLFDLGIVPLLLFRKTRTVAYLVCVAFHLTNSVLFSIHVFPWFMIFATTLFFEPDWPRRVLGGAPLAFKPSVQTQWRDFSKRRKFGTVVTLAYCLFHGVWPFRHLLHGGDASWTERGHLFSWRMMLRGKTAGVRYFITDLVSHETYMPNLRGIINVDQANRFTRDPEMIWQLAKYLAKEHAARTGRTPRVQALVLTSLNGRKPQLFIDPEVDLAAEPKYTRNRPWVLPLKEPLRSSPWKVPLVEWEKHVEMPKLPAVNSRAPN